MGTRVAASIEVYPFDRDALGRSEEGRAFRDALDGIVHSHPYDNCEEVGTFAVELYEVNYGTATFDQEGLSGLAGAAGLWFRQGDDGGPEWPAVIETYTPGGRRLICPVVMFEGPAVTASALRKLRDLGGQAPLSDRVDAFLRLGRMSLSEWAALGAAGGLDRLLDLAGSRRPGGGT